MNDKLFWRYINSSVNELYETDVELMKALDEIGDEYIHAKSIERLLSKKPNDETIKFTNTLKTKINNLFLPHIVELFILYRYKNLETIDSYKFEELDFLEFRAKVIAQGEKAYSTLVNMKTEDDLFKKNIIPSYFYRAKLLHIGTNLIPEMEDSLFIFPEKSKLNKELLNQINWDSIKKDLKKKYPKLWEINNK